MAFGQRSRRRTNHQETTTKKVIRCKELQRPVYEHEVCSKYSVKAGSDTQKNCRTCKHSF